MSSEENLSSVYDNRLLDDSQNYLNRIIKELCDLYNTGKEVMKGHTIDSILYSIDQFMANKLLTPEEIINLCLDDQENPIIQTNPIIQNILASCYMRGKWIKKNESKAFFYFKKSAEIGNAVAIHYVGYCYRNGIGVEKDEHKAFEYYQKSAEIGNAFAIHYVGYCYRNGIGVKKDEHKAFEYYQKSAEMGNADAINDLGFCYLNGIGVEKDEHKAFEYYQKSAEMGNANAISNLGFCYRNGIGVEKDEHKAFEYYQKSAEMGNAVAIHNLGNCYSYGTGVEKDEYKAFEYYQKSAEMGDADAISSLGFCYRNGIGVEKDEHKAFEYYQKSAEMGDADAINDLGYCYRNGIGVEKDEHKAFEYYQKSAEMGNAAAMNDLGICYSYGIGVEKDDHKAFECYQKSAEMGNAAAMNFLGNCYRNGVGTLVDIQKANHWFQKEKDSYQEMIKSTYKDLEIDDIAKNLLDDKRYQLTWIPYEEFKDIKEIGRGGFATVYSARWTQPFRDDYSLTKTFALKKIHNQEYLEYLNELKAYCEIGYKNPSFLKCYGISKDEKGNYVLVLKYANMGSLRENLCKISQMEWKYRLNLLLNISFDLKAIHSQGLIHRDLHSGNILQDNLHSAYITDLGLSIQLHQQKNDKVFGVIPYVAPEVLNSQPFTQVADIYAFGVIMSEISTGQRPFDGEPFNENLAMKICHGARPNFAPRNS